MSNYLSKFSEIVLQAADFHGLEVEVLGRNGEPFAVTMSSIRKALPGCEKFGYWHAAKAQSATADAQTPNGLLETVAYLEFEAFFALVLRFPDPRSERFKDFLAGLAGQYQKDGSVIDHDRGPEAYVPAELKDDPLSIVIGQMLHMRVEAIRNNKRLDGIESEIGRVEAKADHVANIVGVGPGGMTVQAWLQRHNVRKYNAIKEGGRCREIAISMGMSPDTFPKVHVPGEKYEPRVWPTEVLRQFWGEFCRNNNINLCLNDKWNH